MRVRAGKIGVAGLGVALALAAAATSTACTAPSQAKPLHAAITVSWLSASSGTQLPYYAGAPGSVDCATAHPGTGEGCGSVAVAALITGLAGDGRLTGQVTLTWSLVCKSTEAVTTGSATVPLSPAFQSQQDHVSPQTRLDNDTARLALAADLPLGDAIAACTGPSTLKSVTASAVKLHLVRGTSYPSPAFTASGPFQN